MRIVCIGRDAGALTGPNLLGFCKTGYDLSVAFVAFTAWFPSLDNAFGRTGRDDDCVCSFTCLRRWVE